MSKKSVAVRIAGHEYKIRSDAGEESLRQIAIYVDQAMERVRKGTGTVDSFDVAVLTCLNLGRELLALKSQASGGAVDGSLRSLTDRVEAVFPNLEDSGDSSDVAPAADASGNSVASKQASSRKPRSQSASPSTSTSSPTPASASGPSPAREPAKTLDLPAVDRFQDRTASADAEDESESVVPEARVASGGRDRAS